jgi:2-succinyl-6-hydroxy-2,4-cyclohexadiene-1-carboxylate synthase
MLNFEVKGTGKSLVFIHGYLENLKMWKDLAQVLSKHYQIILLDLPGHGDSQVYDEVHTMELMAGKVKETLNYLEVSEALFIGHSMGGYVILALAELYPSLVKSFVLLNSTSFPDSEEKKAQRLKAVETAQKNLDTLIKMSIPTLFAEENLNNLKAEIEFTKELARETPLEGVTAALKGMRLRPDRGFVLDNFEGEIGILIGKQDKAINPTELLKSIPPKENINVLELNTGHMAHLEAPTETLEFIQKMAEKVYD